MERAYSILTVKSVDNERRTFTGTATTPTPDAVDDVIEPLGVEFSNPVPLLLFHNRTLPVGEVYFGQPTADGVPFTASIPAVHEPGKLKDRVDEAWHSVKYKVIKGVSVGIMAVKDAVKVRKSGGRHFLKSRIFELSLVPLPANAEATITLIKSVDAQHLAASGNGQGISDTTPGVSGTPVVKVWPSRQGRAMKSIAEQITSFKSTRDQKWSEMNEIMTKAGEAGETLNAEQSEQYDTLQTEVSAIDAHLKRLEDMETFHKSVAKPVVGNDPHKASASRAGDETPVIRTRTNAPPGIEFTRAVMCKAASFMLMQKGEMMSAVEIAKQRYPDNDRLQVYLKATIPAGTTTDSAWAGALVDPTNLASEFIEFLRPKTIIGRFGTNGIPSLRRVPFNVRVIGQTSGGDAYWVGQGAPKPITKFDFSPTTLGIAKVAAISVITEELARLSSPSAETLVRDGLASAVIARIDTDFVDPAQAAVTNVNPASITNGLVALSPSGTDAAAARADVAGLIKAYLDANNNAGNLVLIMPDALALSLSVMVNSLGQQEFPGLSMNGGSLLGLPVITSNYVANQSGAGNLVIAVNASDIFLADDGQVTVDASREASLQMLDNPTNSSATATATTMVSMFQTNSIALRAERFINWAKRRAEAVVYMDDVNWGSIGSPA